MSLLPTKGPAAPIVATAFAATAFGGLGALTVVHDAMFAGKAIDWTRAKGVGLRLGGDAAAGTLAAYAVTKATGDRSLSWVAGGAAGAVAGAALASRSGARLAWPGALVGFVVGVFTSGIGATAAGK